MQGQGLVIGAQILVKHGQVGEADGGGGVFRPHGLLPNLQSPLVQGQGLVIGAHGLMQPGQVVEPGGGLRVFRPQGLFIDA